VAGMIALTFVIKFLERKNSLKFFGYYRIVLAIAILVVVSLK